MLWHFKILLAQVTWLEKSVFFLGLYSNTLTKSLDSMNDLLRYTSLFSSPSSFFSVNFLNLSFGKHLAASSKQYSLLSSLVSKLKSYGMP